MYQPTKPNTWVGRNDEEEGRNGLLWHKGVSCYDLNQGPIITRKNTLNIAFLGFCSDEGALRGQGRTGAAEGPHALRKALSNLAVHFPVGVRLYDAGDIYCVRHHLESSQIALSKKVRQLLDSDCFPVLFGGSHEISYGHYKGIARYFKERGEAPRIGIINFDSHFELRSYKTIGHSGTSFTQIAQLCEKDKWPFKYMCLGIHEASNTDALFKKARKLKVEYVEAEDLHIIHEEKLGDKVAAFIEDLDCVYLSVCLDVFAAPFAPGVSAPALNGVYPDIVHALVRHIMASRKVIGCDITELNPELDMDERTARLGASLVYEIVKGKIMTGAQHLATRSGRRATVETNGHETVSK